MVDALRPVTRRRALAGLGGLAAGLGSAARAADYPDSSRPVRVLVGYAAGGTVDITARLVSQRLNAELGTTVYVENRAGANGNLATVAVARAAPDGYTLLFTWAGTFTQNPFVMRNLPYDPIKDFTPISLVAQGPTVLVQHVSVPARNLKELIAYGLAHPGKLSIASVGYGSSTHVYAEMLMRETGMKLIHVPYKGTGDAARDLLGGQVQLMFDGAPSAVQNASTGRLRMIGVTGEKRSPLLPELPTITEQGVKGLDLQGWEGYFGPANLPDAIVQKLRDAIVKSVNDPAVKEQINKGLWETVGSTPAELRDRMKRDYDRWGAAIKQVGIEPE